MERAQIHPVAFWLNDGTATIDIGGPELARSRGSSATSQADPRVSFVVDDQAETPNPIGQTGRGIEVRGHAEIVTIDPPLIAAFNNETLRIHPHRIIAWNIGEFTPAPPGRLRHLQGYNSRNVSR